MNATLPHIRPINRPLLRMCSEASQFIRLQGRLGWLCLPENQLRDGYELRTALEVRILPYYEGLFDSAEATTREDLITFQNEKNGISSYLSAYYARSTSTGD